MNQIAWHYTTRDRADAIVSCGEIRPTAAGVPVGEVPAVWFSTARTWEPTASKLMVDSAGRARRMEFPEMLEVGIARFAVDRVALGLLPWPALCQPLNMAPEMADALVRAGRKQGANPGDWYALPRAVRVDECLRVEVYNPAGHEWFVEYVRHAEGLA